MKPRSPIKRGKRPKVISEKRQDEQERRRAVVRAVEDRDRVCQAHAVHALAQVPCQGPLDCHEIIPRSAWRAGYLDASNIVLVCRASHQWIDNHPNGAHALGLHGWSWERPDGKAYRWTDPGPIPTAPGR